MLALEKSPEVKSPQTGLRRERDGALINKISNSPDVAAMLARYGSNFDWSAAAQHCYVLTNGEDACMAFEPKGDDFWECTTVFAKSCRGKRAVETGRAMIEYMRPFARVIFGSVPDDMPHARWFYRQIGGRPVDQVETESHIYTANDGETLFALRFE